MSAKFLLILLTLLFSLSSCIQPLGGEKGLSDIQDGHTPFLNKPEAFEITNVTAFDSALTISWNNSTRALNYSVKYGTSSGTYNHVVSTCSTSPCHITGLTNGQSYFLMVTATNAAGSIDATSEKVGIPSDLPSVPSSLTAVGTGTSIQLNWSASTGPGSITYNVYRSTTSGSGFTSIATGLTAPSFTDSAVTNTIMYYYFVTATNANGTSANSLQVSAIAMTPPSTPSSLVATTGTSNTILNWNASTGLGTITYNVLRSTTSGSGYATLASGLSATTYTDITANNGVTYYYVVTSANAGGTSARSAQVFSTPLSVPTISSITINASGSVALTFTASTGATSYNIKYGTSSNTYSTTLTNVTSPQTISSLTAGTLYYFSVIATNASGSVESSESTATAMASFTISSTTIASSTEVALAWGASNGAASYTVKYGTSSGVYGTTFSTTATSPTTITGLTPGTNYFFMVTAINGSGSLNATAQSSLTPIAVPSAPTTLAANATNGSVALTWTASTGSGTITYNILRSTTSGSGYASLATGVSTNNYTDSTVTNGTTYYYVVTSTNAGGTSANSNQATALPMLPPTTPNSLAATINASDVELNWSASTGPGAISYNIFRSTTSGSGYTTIATGLNTTNYTDSIPTPGTVYYYVVTATNAGGTTANSNQATAVTMPVPVISSITVSGSGSLSLAFTASTGASSYNIKYGTSTNTYTTTVTGATTPATISGLVAGTIYYFKVTAVNSNGTVDSSESSATPLGSFAISSTTITSSTSISLAWGASLGASSYTIKYGAASGVYGTTFSTTATSPTTVTGLTAGTTYYFMISAVNANGSLNANAETSLSPIATPSIPASLSATGSNGSVALSWSVATGMGTITYNVLRSTTSGSGFTSLATNLTTATYTDSTVTNGTTYYYVVTSTNAGGTSANSNQASALPMLPPTAPSSLVATVGTANAQLNWSPSSGLGTITYNILRSTTSGTGYTTLATAVSSTTYADLTAINNTTYYYVVSATNAGGTSFNSNEVEAKPLSLPGITSIAVNGSGSVSLAFSASTGASSYNIKYGTSTNTYTTTVSSVTTPATISGLTAGTTYYFRVVAVNSTGSVDSSESSAIPMGSFTISSATPSAANQITLSWAASTGATSYTVKYGTATGVYGTTFSTNATSPIPVTGLTAGTTYYFMVTTVNTNGSLNATSEISAQAYSLPTTPTSLAATVTTGSQIDLSWSASTGTGSITYDILRSTTSGSGYTSVATGVSALTYNDSSITAGTTYYYVVTATNLAGTTNKSNESSAIGMASFTISSATARSGWSGHANLTWASSTGATSYTVKYGMTSGVYNTTFSTAATSPAVITGLTGGTLYYFMVTAVNASGSVSATAQVSATPNAVDRVVLAIPTSIPSTICSDAITLTAKSAAIATLAVDQNLTVNLTSTGNGTFYSDSSCTTSITTATISAGANSVNVFHINTAPGSQTLSTSQTGLTTSSGSVLILGASKVVASSFHTCAVMNDSTLKCWGLNRVSQLGDGLTTNSYTPKTVPGITTATDVALGMNHTCTLLADHSIKCWGSNSNGQLGNGNTNATSSQVTVNSITTAVGISSNLEAYHTCAVLSDGTAKCWGGNGNSQLGDGTTTTRSAPVDAGLTGVAAVGVGNYHTCAMMTSGAVKCVGLGTSGQLGNGSSSNSATWVDTGITNAVEIYIFQYGGCAKLSTGVLQCWGNNSSQRLGDTGGNRASPTTVTVSGGTFSKFAGGYSFACMLLTNNTIQCSGTNREGEFGHWNTNGSTAFGTISGLTTVTQVSSGANYVCAVIANGTIKCWGANSQGQLGVGVATAKYVPTQTPLTGVESINAGQYHTCAILTDGTGACAGWDQASQLGRGGANASATTHVPVSGLINATDIAPGGIIHTCAVVSNGTVNCWGYGPLGQIGDGSTSSRHQATQVTGITTATKVVVNVSSSCALLTNGTIKCWGQGTLGQLGNGLGTDSTTPVTVSGITTAVDISASYGAFCAVLTDKTIQCWGTGTNGQLGNGASVNANSPVVVTGINNAVSLGSGYIHACAVLDTGAIKCWGNNTQGQFGNGTTISSNTPVTVTGITTARSVSANYTSTCAILTDNSLKCWGDNIFGQVGNNSSTNVTTPVTAGLTNVSKISGGIYASYFCATKTDKTMWCWGYNETALMGLGASDPNFTVQSVLNLFAN